MKDRIARLHERDRKRRRKDGRPLLPDYSPDYSEHKIAVLAALPRRTNRIFKGKTKKDGITREKQRG
jgi:hypothetical protein